METDKNLWWYERLYKQITERGKLRGDDKSKLEGYYERHHIVPRCVGGGDEPENLVLLTFREHVLCHIILTRLYPRNLHILLAANILLRIDKKDTNGNIIKVTIKRSRVAEDIKLKYAEGKTREERIKVSTPELGRRYSKETREKFRAARLGKKHPGHPGLGTKPKPVKDPAGVIFRSLNRCSKAYCVSISTVKGWITRRQGFTYVEDDE
ncbi:MAG: HNH endonuclease [Bacilli bacterium]|nr:HNH endonuclease [Bacilli bacterium]